MAPIGKAGSSERVAEAQNTPVEEAAQAAPRAESKPTVVEAPTALDYMLSPDSLKALGDDTFKKLWEGLDKPDFKGVKIPAFVNNVKETKPSLECKASTGAAPPTASTEAECKVEQTVVNQTGAITAFTREEHSLRDKVRIPGPRNADGYRQVDNSFRLGASFQVGHPDLTPSLKVETVDGYSFVTQKATGDQRVVGTGYLGPWVRAEGSLGLNTSPANGPDQTALTWGGSVLIKSPDKERGKTMPEVTFRGSGLSGGGHEVADWTVEAKRTSSEGVEVKGSCTGHDEALPANGQAPVVTPGTSGSIPAPAAQPGGKVKTLACSAEVTTPLRGVLVQGGNFTANYTHFSDQRNKQGTSSLSGAFVLPLGPGAKMRLEAIQTIPDPGSSPTTQPTTTAKGTLSFELGKTESPLEGKEAQDKSAAELKKLKEQEAAKAKAAKKK